MKKTIKNTMASVLNDFKVNISKNSKLCELKICDDEQLPDYSSDIVQQLYLLRFFPAYLTEYTAMYEALINDNNFKFPSNILSVGMGCGLDYYGLEVAMGKSGINAADYIFYTGIDKVRWKYMDSLNNEDFKFVNEDITSLETINVLPNAPFNTVVFPKSIGVMDDKTFAKVVKVLKNSYFRNRHIYFLFSLSKDNQELEHKRITTLIRAFEKKQPYTFLKDKTVSVYYPEKFGLKVLANDFYYPDEVIRYMKSLAEQCPTYITNGKKACLPECFKLLRSQEPLLTSEHINYQLIKMKKN